MDGYSNTIKKVIQIIAKYKNILEWMLIEWDPNYHRIIAWAERVHQKIADDQNWLFEEYLPHQWRWRLVASGIDIPLAKGGIALIQSARKFYSLL